MRRFELLIAVVFALLMPSLQAAAQGRTDGDWVLLGEIEVGRHLDKDSLGLPDDTPAVSAVRLAAKGGRVVLTRVHVSWADGSVHTEDRIINLLDGERTRPIDPAPQARQVRTIGVIFDARQAIAGRLVLEAWGQRPAPRPAGRGIAAGANEIRLATARPALGHTLDALRLDFAARQLDQIRLQVDGSGAHIASVMIDYASGPSQTLSVDARLLAGGSTVWLPVDSSRAIRAVEVTPGESTDARQTPAMTVIGRPPTPAAARKAAAPRTYRYEQPAPPGSRGVAGGETPVAAATRAAAPAGSAAANCITSTQCTPVPVFFGTSRALKKDTQEIAFTHDRSDALTLGQATVTVPRAYRKKGEIPRPSWWDLARLANPWREDPARHFTILAGATKVYATSEAFLAEVMQAVATGGTFKDHAFVFVHGFNVSFEEGLYRAAQIGYDLGQEDEPFGTAFLFSWPSAGELQGYAYDKDSSRLAVPQLRQFLELVVARSGAKQVHLVAHSMGNAALLAAMEELVKKEEVRQHIGQVILAAPDVDAKEFEGIAARIIPVTRSWTLYASSSDRAMVASREVHVGAPRAGDLINGRPVLIKDLDAIDVSAVSTSIFALNHNVYADRKELLNDMRRLMVFGERPPDVRDINLRRMTDQSGTYWKYVP
ncbi:MAG: alpha/beta fold hydrolase [Hyphomicrobiaceae bacterium]|nr:alpha/beta fold hydrolase [Hyphomicrobiaceae bacterium]